LGVEAVVLVDVGPLQRGEPGEAATELERLGGERDAWENGDGGCKVALQLRLS
jgi:hypothetical protein